MIEGSVTDHPVEVGFGGIDSGKLVPLDPEAGEAFLDDLFCIGGGFGHGQCEGEKALAVVIEQGFEGRLIACSDLRDQISCGIRGFLNQSVPL